MRLVVLASPDSWYLRDLRRAAGSRHAVIQAGFAGLTADGTAGRGWQIRSGDVVLSDADAVLVRTMPPGSLEQVVFRMDCLGRLEAAGVPVWNPPRALEAAVDKYLASAKLAAVGIATPRTLVCQTAEEAMAGFQALGGDVVVKPLFGGEGRGLTRVEDEAIAGRVFKTLAGIGAVLYLQQFVPHHGYDIRLFVVGERVLGMKRRNPLDWRTNVSRGATTEAFDVDEASADLARAAANAVGAGIVGVDVLPGLDGARHVLEVNAVPGWKALGRTLQLDVADLILEYVDGIVSGRSTAGGISTKLKVSEG